MNENLYAHLTVKFNSIIKKSVSKLILILPKLLISYEQMAVILLAKYSTNIKSIII